MGVRLQQYMNPALTPGAALRIAADDLASKGGDTILMPPERIQVDETFTMLPSIALFIPRGGSIAAPVATLTIRGRITSESTAPFSGNVQAN